MLVLAPAANGTIVPQRAMAGRERTTHGVGVGSTRAQVLRLVPGVRCETEGGFAHRFIGGFEPGSRVTDFVFSHGRVSRVTVGIVID